MGDGDEIQGEGAGIQAELHRVAPHLQVFQAPPDEEGDEVLGEQVVDEDQVARPPGDDLPPHADVEDPQGRQVDIELPKFPISSFLYGVPDQIGLEEKPAVGRTLLGQFYLEPSFPQSGIPGLGRIVLQPDTSRTLDEPVQ